MAITGIDLFLLELPLTEPFVASHGTTSARAISVAKVTTDRGTGWGECSALPAATYTAESAAGAFQYMAEDLAPRLLGNDADQAMPAGAESAPMARSCLEMAMLDASLTSSGTPLATWLLATSASGPGAAIPQSVAAGVSLGLDTTDRTVAKAIDLAGCGYGRLKVKIEPGHDSELVTAIRAELPDIELHVDANGAYRGAGDATSAVHGADAVDAVLAVAELGVQTVEQPFPTDDPDRAAELIAELGRRGSDVLVVADEAVERPAQALDLLERHAMSGVSIKPGRLGGLTVARDLHDVCLDRHVAATAGGMLETGLGRHALVALAALPGFTVTGDLSPASRWLAEDPWPDVEMTDGRITVPVKPGVAPEPDEEVLDRFTVSRISVR